MQKHNRNIVFLAVLAILSWNCSRLGFEEFDPSNPLTCADDETTDGSLCELADGSSGICIVAMGGCVKSECGDGFPDPLANETCDDGNAEPNDGCTPDCLVQIGWQCDDVQPSRCAVGAMIDLKANSFTMGAPVDEEGRENDEIQHEVILTHDFSISSTEITQDEFENLMGWNPSSFSGCANCPVENISWYDVLAYANQLTLQENGTPCYLLTDVICENQNSAGSGYMDCMNSTAGGIDSATVDLNTVTSVYKCTGFRLPTEAEWEYATRAGDPRATYNGNLDANHLELEQPNDVLDPIAWFCKEQTHAKGSRLPNNWGLYDTLGNVWEWCWDRYDDYPEGPLVDPVGAITDMPPTRRGGGWGAGWFDAARYLRAANRWEADPGHRENCIGARIARSIHP